MSGPRNAFVGCLLGGAIGDALGYPVEFIATSAEIVRSYGEASPGSLAYAGREARVSDDTQMTLFTVEGLVLARKGTDAPTAADILHSLHEAYQRWYITQTERFGQSSELAAEGWLARDERLWARRAPGNTCLAALRQAIHARAVPTVGKPMNDSKGCGGVMRSAPIGLAAPDGEAAFTVARDAAALTHGHPSGYLSSAYFAALIHDLSRGCSITEAMARADALLAGEPGHAETAAALDAARSLAASKQRLSPSDLESLGGGWTGEEALAIALACALTVKHHTPASVGEALWRSVVHAGDSDSTGSLTGNILGAIGGEACLPERWRHEVELGDLVVEAAERLYSARPGS